MVGKSCCTGPNKDQHYIKSSEVSNEAVEAADSDPCRFDAQRLNLLNWDALWFDLERFRRQRHLDNVTVRKETLRPMLSTPDWYHVLVPSQMWSLNMGNIRHWQSIAFELLSGALEALLQLPQTESVFSCYGTWPSAA